MFAKGGRTRSEMHERERRYAISQMLIVDTTLFQNVKQPPPSKEAAEGAEVPTIIRFGQWLNSRFKPWGTKFS